jgi:hypothetical protein
LATSREDFTPVDQDRWRELRRHVVCMRDALAIVQLTAAGEPSTLVMARKLEGYVKFGLGEKWAVIAKDTILLVLALVAIFAFMTALYRRLI